jgi:RHS repeat-associated protein
VKVQDQSGNWIRGEVYAGGSHLATYTGGASGTTYFDFANWLGTERVRTDTAGTICETITSLPFGDNQVASGTCTDASPMHFTGKERDTESYLDDFGARYYTFNMGRFMSPDPGNIGVKVPNPQSWDAYSYGLNSPVSLADPTGMYVCEDSTDCSSANDQAFAKSLADAQKAADKLTGDEQAAAQRAIDAFGAQGVDNGVNVRFDSNIQGGVTEVSGVANGDKSTDNPTGQNINVTFNPNSVGNDFSGGLAAHEGSHVADGSEWVSSGFSAKLDPTNLTTELNAYHVEFSIASALLGIVQPPAGQAFSGGSMQVGSDKISWSKGNSFKSISPDLQQMIRENYERSDSSAFQKGSVLQP